MWVFQLLLLALLAAPLLAGPAHVLALAVAYAVLLVAGAYKVLSFPEPLRGPAAGLLGFFGLLSLGISGALLAGVFPLWIALAAGVLLAVFFAFMAWRHGVAECELLGWANGFAVVRVGPSLVGVVPPGVYAVRCAKKPSGRRVRVRFSWFNKEGAVV